MEGGQMDNAQGSWTGSTGAPQQPQYESPQQPAPPPPPPPSGEGRKRNWLPIIAIALGAMVLIGGMVLVIVAVVALASGAGEPFGGFGDHVGVITVSGAISAAGEQSLFGAPMGGARVTMAQLRKAADDDGIRAVVLRINSPGGSAAASQEIYEEVRRLAETKPVVVSMADVAASGGYYIAAPADRIVANGSTVTGSIGVRMAYLQWYGLMDRIGLEGGNLTTGPYKDTGSPYRPMREDERELMQDVLDDMYEQFLEAVAEGREMEVSAVRELADGRIFTGEQALELGLIDELGNFYRAVELAGELGGIEGEPRIKDISGGAGILDWMGGMDQLMRRRVLDKLLYDSRLDDIDSLMRITD